MNAMDHVQSERHINFERDRIAFILRWTLEQMKFISYIYTLLLHRFYLLFMKFWLKYCKIRGEENL